MIKRLWIFLLLVASGAAYAQQPAYDKAMADSLGADKYGMRKYYLVLLKTGAAQVNDKDERSKLLKGHMANIERLAAAGKLIVAGPFTGKNELQYAGLFIFKVNTREEAEALLATDPAVNAKLLEPQLLEWYGSAALPAYLPVHERITQEQH